MQFHLKSITQSGSVYVSFAFRQPEDYIVIVKQNDARKLLFMYQATG